MPMGAMKVPLCFSAASMKIVKTSSAVRNISMTGRMLALHLSLPSGVDLTKTASDAGAAGQGRGDCHCAWEQG